MRESRLLLLLTLALAAWAVPAAALPSPLRPLVADDEENEDGDAEEEDEEDRWLAVVGGDVHTGTGAVLRGATVVSKNGVIEEIGWNPWFPEDAEVIDAEGYSVYPGLIAIESAGNIVQASGSFGEGGGEGHLAHGPHGVDPQEVALELYRLATAPPQAAAIEDAFDPFGQGLILALATGITTTVSGDAAIKLKRGEIDDIVMNEGGLQTMSWSVRNPGGKRSLREKFEKARAYLHELQKFQRGQKGDDDEGPSDKGVDGGVLAVLQGKSRAKFTVNDRGDLLSLARFAQEFDFRPVIEGCHEGWTVADELGRAGATVILTPRDRKTEDDELLIETGSTIENAAILYDHGVQVAIVPGNPGIDLNGMMGRDLLALPIEVAFAVRGGLPEDAGLASVTTVPARLLGISHRVGTLEQGKDCDLIVTDGDWMHYETFVQYTVVAGKLVYDKQEEVFFAHIRPRPVEEVEETAEEPEAEDAPGAEEEDGSEANEESTEEAAEDEDSEDEDAGDESEDR